MRRAFALVVVCCCVAGVVAQAGAEVPVTGSVKQSIIEAVFNGPGGPHPTVRQIQDCFDVFRAGRGSSWLIAYFHYRKSRASECNPVGSDGYAIGHYVHARWKAVTGGSEAFPCSEAERLGIPFSVLRSFRLPCSRSVVPTELTARFGLEVKPYIIVWTGDGTGLLGGATGRDSISPPYAIPGSFGRLHWTEWTSDEGRATGVDWVKTCDPDCAGGTFHPQPATVQVYRPIYGVFTRLRIIPRNGRPLTLEAVDSDGGWQW